MAIGLQGFLPSTVSSKMADQRTTEVDWWQWRVQRSPYVLVHAEEKVIASLSTTTQVLCYTIPHHTTPPHPATHLTFPQKCPNINFLQITPVEQLIRTIPEEYTFMKLLDNADQVKFFQREQFWIKRLKTLTPHGLNKKQELPPPIPSIKFSDQAWYIAKLVKTSFEKIQERSGHVY